MSRYNRRKNNIWDTLRDYLVPIIWWILLLLLFWSFLSGEDTGPNSDVANENRIPANINFETNETEAYIVYPWDTTEATSDNWSLYKWESIIVKEWSVRLSPTTWTDIHINKIAELKYVDDDSYALYSSDAWIETEEDLSISMRYASVDMNAWSTISLTQNEAVSSVYVLWGSVKVWNLGGSTTSLSKGQKISIARQDAAKKAGDFDISSEKTDIDSYFKSSDWFIENEWYIALQQENAADEDDNTSASWSLIVWDNSGRYLSFQNLRDEMSTDEATITVTWQTLTPNVGAFSIAGKSASIRDDGNFSVEEISLGNGINDLIVKVYDTDQNILEKKVYTVYSSAKLSTPSTGTTQNISNPNSQASSEIDGTDFGFTAPSVTGKYSTNFGEVTIRGITTAEGITKVEVDGFELASFNGSTWRYHAFTRFWNLKDGTNQYKVDYYKWDTVVYSDYYTIVKKDSSTTNTSEPSTPVNSEETEEEVLEEPETAI